MGALGTAVVESCTIVTVDANALVAGLHDRMPLILVPIDAAEISPPAVTLV